MKALFYFFLTTVLFSIFISCKKVDENKTADEYYKKAGDFYSQNKLDSALYMFTMYINVAKDTLTKGAVYRYMGDMVWDVGDVYAAEEYATGTIMTLDSSKASHHNELGYAYHLLGNIHLDLKHYDEAAEMFTKAASFLTGTTDVMNSLNSKALTFQKKGDYKTAVAIYDSIIRLKISDQANVARIIDNRAKTKWLENPNYPALPEFWHSLKIRTDSQYTRGLNASYAHLSDFYADNNPDSALWYAKKMFQQANIIETPDDRLESIDKLIKLDKTSATKSWYAEYKRLSDSVQLARDTTRNRYALIRYDSQKIKIENFELKEHTNLQRLFIYGLIILGIVIISMIWNKYNKRKKYIKQQAELSIRDSKLKTSQKVHDVVANGLYRIMNELEHGKTIERDPLLDKIEILYEKSRDISYDKYLPQAEPPDYSKHVHELLMAFNNDQTHVVITGNDQAFWSRITARQKNGLQLILTEIMVNMKKHSQANNVALAFSQDQHSAFISYRDDGKGFTAGQSFGNGLNNTVNRIKSLNGDVTFGESGESGVRMYISWPLQPTTT